MSVLHMVDSKDKLLSYVPASISESDEYRKFSQRLSLIAVLVLTALSYILTAALIYHPEIVSGFKHVFPARISARIDELAAYDGISHLSYVGTLIAGAIGAAPIIAVEFHAYWGIVIRSGLAHPMDDRKRVGLVALIVIVTGLVYLIFFSKLGLCESLRTQHIFLWPALPVFGSMIIYTASLICAIILAGIYKLLAQMRGGL